MTKDDVKALIAFSGKTQKELAECLGIKPQNFNNRLNRGSFTDQERRELAKACGAEYRAYFEYPDGTKININ